MCGKWEAFWQFLKDFTECPICFDILQQPKMLPCLHTFCQACLSRLASGTNKEIICPTCRAKARLPQEGVGSLQTNFLTVRMLELGRPTRADSGEVLCDSCTSSTDRLSPVAPAIGYCVDCRENVCQDCVTAHAKMRALRGHRLIQVETENAERLHDLLISRPVYCSEHPQDEISFHCSDCSTQICLKCCILKHKFHSYSDIREKADVSRKELKDIEDDISRKLLVFKSASHELQQDLETLNATAKQTEEAIASRTEDVLKQILDDRNRLLDSVKNFEKFGKKEIETTLNDVHTTITSLESFNLFCQELKDRGAHADVLRLLPQVITRANELKGTNYTRVPPPSVIYTPSMDDCDPVSVNFLGQVTVVMPAKSEICQVQGDREVSITDAEDVNMNASTNHSESDSGILEECDDSLKPFAPDAKLASNWNAVVPTGETNTSQHSETDDIVFEVVPSSVDSEYLSDASSNMSEDNDLSTGKESILGERKSSGNEEDCPGRSDKNCIEESDKTDSLENEVLSMKQEIVYRRKESTEIETINSNGCMTSVSGIAVLNDYLYVVRKSCHELEIYDKNSLEQVRTEQIKGLTEPIDLTACAWNCSIYIGHTMRMTFSVRLSENTLSSRKFYVSLNYKHISATSEGSVLFGCPKAQVILEYKENPKWSVIRRISLPNCYPTGMVQLSPNRFVVSSKINVLYMITENGRQMKLEKMNVQHNVSHLTTDINVSSILIADSYGHKIHRMTPGIAGNRSVSISEQKTISQPYRLCVDKTSCWLFVATCQGEIKRLPLS